MSDHVKNEKLNLEEVGRYFESKGYKVQKLEQPWRHVVGQVKFENEKLFVKLASTTGAGERTINEATWNRNLNVVWKKYITTFKTPKIFDDGYFEDRYWFIGEYVFGKPLARISDKNTDIPINDLQRSAEIAREILKLTKLALLPKDVEHFKEIWRQRMIEVARMWSKEIRRDTKKLLRLIELNIDSVDIGSTHGDFTPWHIMKTDNNHYYLIDGEAAQIAGPKFYDVAYYYHRVYTKLQRPDLAELFLSKFKNIYDWNENDEKLFIPVLASRIIGGYFDAERDGVTSLELNMEMEKNLIN